MAAFPQLSAIPKAFGDALVRLFNGSTFVTDGLAITAHGAASLQIDVAAGRAVVNGVRVTYAGGNVVPGVASGQSRIDLIRIASGAVVPSIIAGAPAAAPVEPALPAGDLYLGQAFIPAGAIDYTTGGFVADYTVPNNMAIGDFNVRAFGAKGDGVTDDTATFTAAIGQLPANGGRILIPPASGVLAYILTAQLDLRGKQGVTIEGTSGGLSSGAFITATLRFTQAGVGDCINVQSSAGVTIRNIFIEYQNAAFTGRIIDARGGIFNGSDTSKVLLEDMMIQNIGGSGKPLSLVDLDKTIISTLRRCTFVGIASASISGRQLATYSNAIQIRDSLFQNADVAIQSPGQGWIVDGCTFEPTSGSTCAHFRRANGACNGLTITGCWFGDAANASAPGMIDVAGNGITVTGNYIAIPGVGVGVAVGGASDGILIAGNDFEGATAFAVSLPGNESNCQVGPVPTTNGITVLSSGAVAAETVIFPAPKAHVTHSAVQAIPTAALTALNFDTDRYNPSARITGTPMHNTVVNNTRLTMQVAGRYRVGAMCAVVSAAGTIRIVSLRRNGAVEIGRQEAAPVGNQYINLMVESNFAAGDYVEALMFQDSGGASNTIQLAELSPEFWASRIN